MRAFLMSEGGDCMRIIVAGAAVAAFLLLTGSAVAQPVEDSWFVALDENNDLVPSLSGGSGYENGSWYFYPNTLWYNEWFYNAPYDPDRWKIIHIEFDADTLVDTPLFYLQLAVNWSTPEWSLQTPPFDRPPLPGDEPEDLYIMRDTLLETDEFTTSPQHFVFDYVIPDYNPEWVSIDVWGFNFQLTDGIIIHECVPEPGGLGLVVLGLLALRRR
jgi:hypothetical protein